VGGFGSQCLILSRNSVVAVSSFFGPDEGVAC